MIRTLTLCELCSKRHKQHPLRIHSRTTFKTIDQGSSMMPEVQELFEALPELTSEPITGVVVVACRSKAPAEYSVVAQTTDGSDADLWKDGLFKSKVTRYLCFTRDNSQSSDVLLDMRLIDLKDTLPEGFIPIQETIDTKEPALRKKRLCVRLGLRLATETAVCDIQIQGKSKHTCPHYTCIGELNNMDILYRTGNVHPSTETAIYNSMPNTTRQRGRNVAWREKERNSCRGREGKTEAGSAESSTMPYCCCTVPPSSAALSALPGAHGEGAGLCTAARSNSLIFYRNEVLGISRANCKYLQRSPPAPTGGAQAGLTQRAPVSIPYQQWMMCPSQSLRNFQEPLKKCSESI
uniref:Multivesicular body subunit 12Bb n=1 Tax=Oncorhynchus kisutch TaxID=8019 RepID=A0A8C7GD75_ONCKI